MEVEKGRPASHLESNPGHLWLELPLSFGSQTTTSPHDPPYVLWYKPTVVIMMTI